LLTKNNSGQVKKELFDFAFKKLRILAEAEAEL
jgi:hypothetical protein